MYTEAMLFTFAHAVRNSHVPTSILMRRLDLAASEGLFIACTWGNMSEAQVDKMAADFMLGWVTSDPYA